MQYLLIQEDSDVATERRRVNSMTAFSQSDAVVIKNLVKVIDSHA